MVFFIALALSFIQILLFVAHWFLYKTLVFFLGLSQQSGLIFLQWLMIILSLSFVIGSLLTSRFDNWFTRMFYTGAAIWLGCLTFLIIACFLSWLVFYLGSWFKFSGLVNYLSLAFFLIAIVVSFYSVANAYNVRVTSLNIKLANLPASWQGKKIVWISDIHLGAIHNLKFAQRLADKIQELKPDLIFIGGDLYDGVKADLDKLVQPFAKLNQSFDTYFITGNHEEFSDKAKYLEAVKKTGIKVLDNEMISLDGLQLIGVDYNDSHNRQNLESILAKANINRQLPAILLKHEPKDIDLAEQAGVSLVISGHTHDGQVWPFNYVVSAVYHGYGAGLNKYKDMIVYTSTGAGTWGPPLRLGNYPEIVIINLN
jgi:uncharacterized protein